MLNYSKDVETTEMRFMFGNDKLVTGHFIYRNDPSHDINVKFKTESNQVLAQVEVKKGEECHYSFKVSNENIVIMEIKAVRTKPGNTFLKYESNSDFDTFDKDTSLKVQIAPAIQELTVMLETFKKANKKSKETSESLADLSGFLKTLLKTAKVVNILFILFMFTANIIQIGSMRRYLNEKKII